jgi:DNA-binding transcriptional regulator YdaS (Cro superfamily)
MRTMQEHLLTYYKLACYRPFMENGIGALKTAISHLGSQVAAARVVGVTPQAVSEIVRRGKRVPAEWCRAIEQATGGAVSAHALRPDLYPPSQKAEGEIT